MSNMEQISIPHQPVLKNEVISALNLRAGDNVIDCTIGAGGHSETMLQKIGDDGRLLGLDVDSVALKIAQMRFVSLKNKKQIHLVQSNFDQLAMVASTQKFTSVQAIIADLGVSSMQLDEAKRGFSFGQGWPIGYANGHNNSSNC